MDDAWGRLGAELQSQEGVDCLLIADLAETICSLSEKLCDLSEAEPEDQELLDRCEDGRNRCQRALQERDERCPERRGSERTPAANVSQKTVRQRRLELSHKA